MLTPRIRSALIALAASAGLAGCAAVGSYGGVSVGVGSGYGGYGGYGYDPYYAGYGHGSAYGYNRYGWYNDFYYPGTGWWVYDRDRNRRAMTRAERAYWDARIREYVRNRRVQHGNTATATAREDWSGFGTRGATANAGAAGQPDQRSVRQLSDVRRQAQAERQQVQQQARSERQQARSERRESARQQAMEQRESRRVRKSADD